METVSHGVCAVFGAVAVLTKHKHWSKTTDKVEPISAPLCEWINSMDPETVERLQKYLLPMSVLTGVVAVVTPDIMVEIELKKLVDAQRRGLPSSPPHAPSSSPVMPPVESRGDGAVAGNVNGQGSTTLPGPISVTAPPEDL